jgi:hypothetical protein
MRTAVGPARKISRGCGGPRSYSCHCARHQWRLTKPGLQSTKKENAFDMKNILLYGVHYLIPIASIRENASSALSQP